MGKNSRAVQETWIQSLGWKVLLEKGMATLSSIFPGEFHGQRSLAGYSPWGHKETRLSNSLFRFLRASSILNMMLGLYLHNLF